MRMGGEQSRGMPAAARGGVDHDPRGHRGKQRHHLVDHDRLMAEHLAHPQPLDWRDAVGRVAPATRLEAGGGGVFHRTSRGAAHVPGVVARPRPTRPIVVRGTPFLLVVPAPCRAVCGARVGGPRQEAQSSAPSVKRNSSGPMLVCHRAGSHSSTLSITPTTVTSLSSAAYCRIRAGSTIRP